MSIRNGHAHHSPGDTWTPRARPTGLDLFILLWSTLADIVGTAATATLIRRAARRAASEAPELEGLVIRRHSLEYRYEVPEAWRLEAERENVRAFRALVQVLGPLLVDLAGPILVRRLEQLEPFRTFGVLSTQEVTGWLIADRPDPSIV